MLLCSCKFLYPCSVSRVVKEGANESEPCLRTVGTGHIGQLDTLSKPYVLLVLLFDDNISETDSYEYLFNISTDTATEVRLYMLYE